MKFKVFSVFICIALFFIVSGCSREDDQPVSEVKTSVKKPIVMPLPLKSPAVKPPSESDNTYTPDIADGAEITLGKGASDALKGVKESKDAKEEEKGVYVTEKGDTLSSISGKDKVMGDSLKWPILYRMNFDRLKDLTSGADLPYRPLPEGIRLTLVTDEMLKDNLKTMPENLWVINILSSTTKEKIIPVAIRLVQEGYIVYIARANIKGQDWMRLRVGFYQGKNVTDLKGQRIKDVLNISDIWTVKIEKNEFLEFAGYQVDL